MTKFVKEHLSYVAGILILFFLTPPVVMSGFMLSLHLYNILSPTNCIQKK